ncbi:MAG: epoxyqueuosine reductase QueH [Oscillospiraceae bacterium]
MEQKINYQRRLDELIKTLDYTPRLLLHSCCAPCSSYCLEYLARYFSITVLYYNPNISPEEEFCKRAEEQRRLITALPAKNPISLVVDDYNPREFYDIAKGLEDAPEGGERCFKCYRLRLERAAEYAAEHGFDYFCTTLSISPLKNAAKLNEIGETLEAELGIKFLPSDFKKKGGYLRSIELSREYGLYRQNYCGCVFSKPKEE